MYLSGTPARNQFEAAVCRKTLNEKLCSSALVLAALVYRHWSDLFQKCPLRVKSNSPGERLAASAVKKAFAEFSSITALAQLVLEIAAGSVSDD